MTIEQAQEKIRKLLSLAARGNEHEAKVAMAKAQKLMAEYKLDAGECCQQSEIVRIETQMYYTPYRNAYRNGLAAKLANLYCCEMYSIRSHGSQKRYLCLIGAKSDVNILQELLWFADGVIQDWFRTFKKEEGWHYSNQHLNAIKNQYGMGFAQGLSDLLEEQKTMCKQEWGLVLSVPKAATDFVRALRQEQISYNYTDELRFEAQGYRDGLHAEIDDKLPEGNVR